MAPTVTHTFSSLGAQPRMRCVNSQMAVLSAGMPVTGPYLEAPASMARLAASSTSFGGSKSGSPTPKAKTSTPFALSSRARAFIASVALGWTAFSLDASVLGTLAVLARPCDA